LTWLGNTSRLTRRTPANTRPAPARAPVQDKALIGFRQPDNPPNPGNV